ncbi:MAG: DUF5110 domain-containing protein [Bacteroidales bacterium]|jgi:alpha-glucosidase (family GH31 glycosyl hydrolase)|nr:DUF5110 domain-containing protein [Bacteroidales bacterium]
MKKNLVLPAITLLLLSCVPHNWQKTGNGVVIKVNDGTGHCTRRVSIEIITDKIIHVTAFPKNSFSQGKSLCVINQADPAPFNITEKNESLILSTACIKTEVSLKTGRIIFRDKNDNILLAEPDTGGKTFTPVIVEGTSGYAMRQVFESPDDEAFYGLVQHQSDEFNYKGLNESLYQYNTRVSVPFIVSNRNYGILWNNYSLTKLGDPRDYSEIYLFRLYDEQGDLSLFSEMGDQIDYYFIAGENIDNVISGYRTLTGKAPIMPKWAMGYNWFYWPEDSCGSHEFNPETFPDPSGMVDSVHKLNARWYQNGSFCPLFRSHGQYPYREVYNIPPEGHPAYKSMVFYDKLRYFLMPYTYSLAALTYFNDYTIMRAMVMDFGGDENVESIGDQYMFGPSLLVAPVYKYKARTREVYLPSANGWYDLYSGKYFAGGQKIDADAPYERMPLFVKEGSIIPVGTEIQYVDEKPADPLTLLVYTGRDCAFTLYEDEGVNYNYEKGKCSTIKFNFKNETGELTIDDRKGEFQGMLKERTFNIKWITKEKQVPFTFEITKDTKVVYNGEEITVLKR